MKKFIRSMIMLTIGFTLALLSAAYTHSASTQLGPGNTPSATFFAETTTTSQPKEDISEIGSTDEIAAMGFIIVLIVIIPIFLRRKSWAQPE